jgi:hypothetical protein
MNRVSMSVTAKGKRWETLHSLWVGWTFTFGLFNWIAFIYIGLRAKQRKWILWGVLYLVPIAVVILLAAADASATLGLPAVLLTFGLGVTSIFHAFRVRKEYLVRLAPAKTVQGNGKGGRSTPGDSEGRKADTDHPDKGMSPERLRITSTPTNYPLPLAYSYRLADAEFETFRVLKELYRNAEGLTAFLASLALVLAPTPTGKRKDTLLWAWRGKGATFGSWYAILEKTTPTIEEDKGHLYRSMQQLLGTKANPSSFAETITWLIDRRNDLHHGDLPVGPRADLLIQEVRSRFEHCASEA